MSGYGEAPRKECSKCGKNRFLSRDYYMSNSDKHRDGRISVCKQCINKDLEVNNRKDFMTEKFISKAQDKLLDMNRPYIHSVWVDSVEEVKERGHTRIFGIYIKNLLLNHKDKNWRDSEEVSTNVSKERVVHEDTKSESGQTPEQKPKKRLDVELDTQNEKDVLRLLGYDPFEFETESDRPNLFNKLVDYLDESTLEDGFKLTSVIEIVRTFNQLDKINAAISRTFELERADLKGVTSLVGAKDRMMKTALDIAKENGISVKHATNRSQGAGTLSGILKQLNEYDIHEADTNLFNVKTAKGVRQVAEISNESIMKQLSFDENDLTNMIKSQRVLMQKYQENAEELEEENRLLRVELAELKSEFREIEKENAISQ